MATETVDSEDEDEGGGWDDHPRGLTVTTFGSLIGIAAGVAASSLASGAGDTVGVFLLVGAIAVQIPVYMALGMNVDDFGAKGYLYIAFITFSMWFISWGILLTTGASV
jgi:hypothetical protein